MIPRSVVLSCALAAGLGIGQVRGDDPPPPDPECPHQMCYVVAPPFGQEPWKDYYECRYTDNWRCMGGDPGGGNLMGDPFPVCTYSEMCNDH
jgi:hypothetical protein